jgi:hypothetical protein
MVWDNRDRNMEDITMPQSDSQRYQNITACHTYNTSISQAPFHVGMAHPTTGDYLTVNSDTAVRGCLANGFKILDTPKFHANLYGSTLDTPANFVATETLPVPFYRAMESKKQYFPAIFP